MLEGLNTNTPRVFISYAWEDEAHKEWVRKFADLLIENKIDAIIDQYDLSLGDRLPAFMEQSINQSDYVLIICTPTYKEKSDLRIGGVGYEGHIISDELFSRHNERKFIPVIKKGTFETAVPKCLSGKLGVDLTDNSNKKENMRVLIETILGINRSKPMAHDKYSANAFSIKTSALTVSKDSNDKLEMKENDFSKKLVIDIKSISYNRGSMNHTFLKDISLSINSGNLVLVIGGPGSAKNMLMHLLALKNVSGCKLDGKIVFDGKDLKSTSIEQDGQVVMIHELKKNRMPTVKVYDSLYREARKWHRNYNSQSLHSMVEDVLEITDLKEVAQYTINYCSEGQKERINIAYNYLKDPSIVILEEPFIGLNVIEVKKVLYTLKRIANQGKIVITGSLTPDRIFDVYDRIIVLARSDTDFAGHLVYDGSPSDACLFFGTGNIEEIIEKTSSTKFGGMGYADYYIAKYLSYRDF